MTTAEITTLRKELEDALLKAFTDFKCVTGVSVSAVDVKSVLTHQLNQPRTDIHTCGVSVILESL